MSHLHRQRAAQAALEASEAFIAASTQTKRAAKAAAKPKPKKAARRGR